MPNIAISLDASADLGAVAQTKSALDGLNTSVQQGAKSSRSAVEGFTQSGVSGFEQLRRKVVELRTEYAGQRQELLNLKAAYDGGRISQTQFEAGEQKLQKEISASKFAMQTARQEMGALTGQMGLAMEPMRMMAEGFGVHIPMGMTMMLAKVPGVQNAMESLFNVSMIGFFAAEGIRLTGELWDYMKEKISEVDPALKSQIELIHQLNKELENKPKTLAEAASSETKIRQSATGAETKLEDLQGQLQLSLAMAQSGAEGMGIDPSQIKQATADLALYNSQLTDAMKTTNEMTVEDKKQFELREKLYGELVVEGELSQRMAGVEDAQQKKTIENRQRDIFYIQQRNGELAQGIFLGRQEGQILAGKTKELEKQNETNAALAAMQHDAAISQIHSNDLEMEQRKKIAEYDARQADIAKHAADERARQIDREATQIENMFDRVFLRAKSFKDAISNLWKELAQEQFHNALVQALQHAGSPSGGGGSSAGGGGGWADGGLGGGIPPGLVIENFTSNGTNSNPLGSTGGGAGAVTAKQAGMDNVATQMGMPATTPLGNIFAKLKLSQRAVMELMGGLTAASMTMGASHGALSNTLGGALSGALMAMALGTKIGMFAGPMGALLGAGIGAAVGGLISIISGPPGNKQKDHDSALENQTFAQMRQVLDDYQHQRTDYATAMNNENKLWNDMVPQFQRKDSAITQRPYFDQIIKAMQDTEDERNRRRQLMSMGAIPEFASGGLVGADGGMMAKVHVGEFVMTRQAVDRIGASVLAGMNSGLAAPSSPSNDSSFTVRVTGTTKEKFADLIKQSWPVFLGMGGQASRVARS